jgi:uncharacterized membrane protein YeaQ/YmgE (transglycosylase-associated protein family)
MGIIGWIVIGGLAGALASYIMKEKHSWVKNIIVGIVGAFIGGFVVGILGGNGVTGFNLWSFLVATLGAVILIAIMRSLDDKKKPAKKKSRK